MSTSQMYTVYIVNCDYDNKEKQTMTYLTLENGLNYQTKEDYIAAMVLIGFCQKKFYKTYVWERAVIEMEKLVKIGLAKRYNYGKGKGKYTTTENGEKIGLYNLHKSIV